MVAERMGNRIQLTDGLSWYLRAVEDAFGWNGVDFGQIIKTYRMAQDETAQQRRYSRMECTGALKRPIMGNLDESKISTSVVERQNLNIRMQQRRYTRLTKPFSKKTENHAQAFSMYAMVYNYCRPHTTLAKANTGIKTTPAMASGLTDHAWTVEEILEQMDPKRPLHSN